MTILLQIIILKSPKRVIRSAIPTFWRIIGFQFAIIPRMKIYYFKLKRFINFFRHVVVDNFIAKKIRDNSGSVPENEMILISENTYLKAKIVFNNSSLKITIRIEYI